MNYEEKILLYKMWKHKKARGRLNNVDVDLGAVQSEGLERALRMYSTRW